MNHSHHLLVLLPDGKNSDQKQQVHLSLDRSPFLRMKIWLEPLRSLSRDRLNSDPPFLKIQIQMTAGRGGKGISCW